MLGSLICLVFFVGVPLAVAGDVPVTYLVQDKPLKEQAVAGTQLTFTLYGDAACTRQVHQAVIPIDDVDAIAKLKRFTPKRADKRPNTNELRTTLAGVTAGGPFHLVVTGTGVTPSGPACQAQAARGSGGTVVSVTLFPDCPSEPPRTPCIWEVASGFRGSCGGTLLPTTPEASDALDALDATRRHACELTTNGGAANAECGPGLPVPAYALSCSPLAASCDDGIENQGEGGADCGGPCTACGLFSTCNQNADCASGLCRARSGPCNTSTRSICIPATCGNGQKDGSERGVDCGWNACANACPLPAQCSTDCDCASGTCPSFGASCQP